MLTPLKLCAGIIPTLILLAVDYFDRRQRKRAHEKSPIEDKFLRPAGHSLNLKIQETGESLMVWILAATWFTMFYSVSDSEAWSGKIINFCVFGPVIFMCILVALKRLKTLRQWRLGLLGEQAVAEQLQSLLAAGYQVFHDLQVDGKWNIDHIVVGPTGVFAIETKCRRKKGVKNFKATYDDKSIQFPASYETEPLEQAKRNAKWLADMLSKSTGERVTVTPLVALPGWYVTCSVANPPIPVLNQKMVPGYIAGRNKSFRSKPSPRSVSS